MIVPIFKQRGISNKLPIDKRLIQATETRFGTFYIVAKRVTQSANEVLEIIEEEGKHIASDHFKSLHQFEIEGSNPLFPALYAINNFVHLISNLQNVIKTSNRPVLHYLLPKLESLKIKLSFMSKRIAQGSPPVFPDHITHSPETQALENIESTRVHGLWILACILNPGLRSSSFVEFFSNLEEWKSISYSMI